ncbi:hypothetical protein B0H10DRAFT_2184050 [Mycena sp. CBHHK59/15]|nr:hypothetical protein B0H10DRAFT_2184050 [Mycena sp. CBHHK59/15]
MSCYMLTIPTHLQTDEAGQDRVVTSNNSLLVSAWAIESAGMDQWTDYLQIKVPSKDSVWKLNTLFNEIKSLFIIFCTPLDATRLTRFFFLELNLFWKIRGSYPHEAISHDPLHADDGGFWGGHLLVQITARVTELGRAPIVKIDAQMAAFPHWSGLNHFETVMNTSFNDGSKHKDITKMMLFVAHIVLIDDVGLLLLQALRSYLELCTSITFEVHTSVTIADGCRELLTLGSVMKKGASWNFGTKTDESMHREIQQTYHRWTNFKDMTPQLVKHDHHCTVATFIREQIDVLNEDPEGFSDIPEDLEASALSNIGIGSKVKPVSFSTVEQEISCGPTFE